MPVAMTPRRCPTCEEEYHGTVLTERRDRKIRSVRYSPCPKCGTVPTPHRWQETMEGPRERHL